MDIITRKERIRRIILIVVGCLAAVAGIGFGIHAQNKRDEERPKITDQKAKNRALKDDIAFLRRETILFSEPIGFRSRRDVLFPELLDVPVQYDVIREYLNGWRARLADKHGVSGYKEWPAAPAPAEGAACLDVQELFGELRKLREAAARQSEALAKEAGIYEPGAGTFPARYKEKVEAVVKDQGAADQAVRGRRVEEENSAKSLVDRKKEVLAQLTGLETTRIDECGKTTDRINELSQEKQKKIHEKKELQERLEWIELEKERAREEQQADGAIVHSDHAHGVVYIDLAVKDGLFRGTKFKVFSLKKAGVKKDKGEVQVFDVGVNYSKCAILRSIDPADPIATGDLVYDEFYDRHRDLLFSFAGRFIGKYTNAEMERKLRAFPRYGFTPKVNREVNYLVAGDGYDATPHYVEAVKYGIKIIREKDLYAFLGLEY